MFILQATDQTDNGHLPFTNIGSSETANQHYLLKIDSSFYLNFANPLTAFKFQIQPRFKIENADWDELI